MEKSVLRDGAIENFDPNGMGIPGRLFGLPFDKNNASIVIIPIPWEVTVSYHNGAARGPSAILDASIQVDLFIRDVPNAWKVGIAMLKIPDKLHEESSRLRELAIQHVKRIENGIQVNSDDPLLTRINEECENLNIYVKSSVKSLLSQGKLVGLLGGDHSTPLGFIRALSEQYERFGILQIDAHADLRKSYQGFSYSHASVMYNALKLPAVHRLVQVGIRDLCEEEMSIIARAKGRVVTFFDDDIQSEKYRGKTWSDICDKIVASLPDDVYISFDIDGLDPKFCPNTGTPVPGGLEFSEVAFLLRKLIKAKKRIIGFDLVEVAPSSHSDWDANVAARMLYQLSNLMAVSRGKLALTQ